MGEENACVVKWMCVFNNVEMHIWLWKYTFLFTSGYGHDESVPYAWRSVRNQFRGWALVFHGMFVGILRCVLCVFRWCSLRISRIVRWHFAECSPRNWQTVRSRRGPIYRARIYECTHEIGNGNVYSMKWMYIFNNVKTRVWWNGYVHLIMSGYGHDESVPYAWRNVRNQFRGWALVFHGMFVGILWSVLP